VSDDIPPDSNHGIISEYRAVRRAIRERHQRQADDIPAVNAYSGAALLASPPAPRPYLVAELIAADHVALLAGPPKSGKSWFALQLAQAVDQGTPFLDWPVRRGRILYLALEDGRSRFVERCRTLNWQPQNLVVAFNLGFSGKKAFAVACDLIAKHRPFSLVIIDTLRACLGSFSESSNATMAAVFYGLGQIAHAVPLTILFVHHTAKGDAAPHRDPFSLIRGASAIRGGYDLGLVLLPQPGDGRALLHVEGRDTQTRAFPLQPFAGGAPGWRRAGDAVAPTPPPNRAPGQPAVQALLRHGDGLSTPAVAEILAVSRQAAHYQLCNAERAGLVVRRRQRLSPNARLRDYWYLAAP
jgi:hypothetical protein